MSERSGKASKKENDSYTIGELARRADVTARTVRFYVAEGLLPPPEGAGRAALYTTGHLTRLELIKLLKEEFLPLAEIRDLVAGLTQSEIEELLAQKRQPTPPPGQESAREYIQTLLQTGSAAADSPATLRQVVAGHHKTRSAPGSSQEEKTPPTAAVESAATWGRISLHPDVELHVRQPPTDARTPARIQQLLEAARRLFKP